MNGLVNGLVNDLVNVHLKGFVNVRLSDLVNVYLIAQLNSHDDAKAHSNTHHSIFDHFGVPQNSSI